MSSMARITIFDTTLRDGEQAPGFSLDVPAKLAMARALDALGGVRVHMLSLSATGINLTMVVDDDQLKPAIQRLHAAFFERGEGVLA